MNQVELLAPAGSMEALYAAVQCGADAVYLGGTSFGARAFADNFDEETLREAVAYAHIYGVSVYVTVNTLIHEEELETCLDYIGMLQDCDVDAIILQDLGMLRAVHHRYPDLEIHASTQMHIHNRQGIQFLKDLGVSRVVVARETTIEEIRAFTQLGIEIEVFIQGALCVCYSGQCLLSADLFERSGNRGMCAQPCRMRYTLLEDGTALKTQGNYLLSPKDLYTLDHIGELIEAGVISFKIEGRMKKSAYVAQAVKSYREAIDAYLQHRHYPDQKDQFELAKLFNRGFSAGHLFHQRGLDLMNLHRPNHMGVKIGTVTAVRKDKIRIAVCEELHQHDGIRILNQREDIGFMVNRLYDLNGKLVNAAKAGTQIELDQVGMVSIGDVVLKTSDVLLEDTLKQLVSKNPRTIAITGFARFQLGKRAVLQVSDGIHQVKVESEMTCELAKNQGMSEERISSQLMKLGGTPYRFEKLKMVVDDALFITIKELNQMRRMALEQLSQLRSRRYHRTINQMNLPFSVALQPKSQVIVHVETLQQAQVLLHYPVRISAAVALARQLEKKGISCIKEGKKVMCGPYHDEAMIQEVGGLSNDQKEIAAASLYAWNHEAMAFLYEQGIRTIILPYELKKEQIASLMKGFQQTYHQNPSCAVLLYGRIEDMISRHCVISTCLGNGAMHCGICHQHEYALRDEKGRVFPIKGDEDCLMHLYSHQTRNWINDLSTFQKMGVSSFYLTFLSETEAEVKAVMDEMFQMMGASYA